MKRDHIRLTEKLASALAHLAGIPYDHRELMTAEQVISLFHFDHDPIPHAPPYNGPDLHYNLTPRLITPHREKTAKVDVPRIAKTKRIIEAEQAFRDRLLASPPRSEPKKRSIPSRPFPRRRKRP